MAGRAHDFTDVDAGRDPASMVSYLDDVARIAAEGKRLSYAALQLRTGMSVLDVGCGAGDDVRALAEIVGPGGLSAGVDSSRTMIEQAAARGVPANVRFELGSAAQLPFGDETFDAVRSERVFQHLREPQHAARETFRVLKPGGIAMLMDPDWGTMAVAGSQASLTRRIVSAYADHVENPWAGRNHAGLMHRANFTDVVSQPFAVTLPFAAAAGVVLQLAVTHARESGHISPAEGAQWLADLQTAAERGEFVCVFTFFTVTARRPA